MNTKSKDKKVLAAVPFYHKEVSQKSMRENKDKSLPIGVFDSGVGGITVLKEIMEQLPGENVIYFGDTARVPYGGKAKMTIVHYSKQIVSFLQTQKVKAIVIACNTASALALDEIQDKVDIPIIGVVRPGAKAARLKTHNKRIGVIGTKGTIKSGIYPSVLQKEDERIQVYGRECPLFVPLVEEGWQEDPVTLEISRRYLEELTQKDIDCLILGCTHYPLLVNTLQRVLPSKVELINPAYETAKALGELLEEKDMKNLSSKGSYQFYVSDEDSILGELAQRVLGMEGISPVKINIEEY